MPLMFSAGMQVHDDSYHQTSAKRNGASGVAPLDGSKMVPIMNLIYAIVLG